MLQLPAGQWSTVLDCLCAHFEHISREQWLSRMTRNLVLDDNGQALNPAAHIVSDSPFATFAK